MQGAIVTEAGRRERNYRLDLWRYRELFRVLAWRDLSVRYKQTVIGVLWHGKMPASTIKGWGAVPSDGRRDLPEDDGEDQHGEKGPNLFRRG